jgi:hypothetical protein
VTEGILDTMEYCCGSSVTADFRLRWTYLDLKREIPILGGRDTFELDDCLQGHGQVVTQLSLGRMLHERRASARAMHKGDNAVPLMGKELARQFVLSSDLILASANFEADIILAALDTLSLQC